MVVTLVLHRADHAFCYIVFGNIYCKVNLAIPRPIVSGINHFVNIMLLINYYY